MSALFIDGFGKERLFVRDADADSRMSFIHTAITLGHQIGNWNDLLLVRDLLISNLQMFPMIGTESNQTEQIHMIKSLLEYGVQLKRLRPEDVKIDEESEIPSTHDNLTLSESLATLPKSYNYLLKWLVNNSIKAFTLAHEVDREISDSNWWFLISQPSILIDRRLHILNPSLSDVMKDIVMRYFVMEAYETAPMYPGSQQATIEASFNNLALLGFFNQQVPMAIIKQTTRESSLGKSKKYRDTLHFIISLHFAGMNLRHFVEHNVPMVFGDFLEHLDLSKL